MWLSSGLDEQYRLTCHNADVVDILGISWRNWRIENLQQGHLSVKGVTAAEEQRSTKRRLLVVHGKSEAVVTLVTSWRDVGVFKLLAFAVPKTFLKFPFVVQLTAQGRQRKSSMSSK